MCAEHIQLLARILAQNSNRPCLRCEFTQLPYASHRWTRARAGGMKKLQMELAKVFMYECACCVRLHERVVRHTHTHTYLARTAAAKSRCLDRTHNRRTRNARTFNWMRKKACCRLQRKPRMSFSLTCTPHMQCDFYWNLRRRPHPRIGSLGPTTPRSDTVWPIRRKSSAIRGATQSDSLSPSTRTYYLRQRIRPTRRV